MTTPVSRDEHMVTEREAIKRERAAFERGYRTRWWEVAQMQPVGAMRLQPDEATALSAVIDREYPLPPITRPLRGMFSDRTVAWWDESNSVIRVVQPHADGWHLAAFARTKCRHASDFILLGRMLSGETETVPEDQEGDA